MKNTFTKVLSLTLAMALACVSFASCSSKDEAAPTSSDGASKTSSVAAEPEKPKTNADRENVEITFSQANVSTDNTDKFKDDPILKEIQNATNLKINWDSGFDGYEERMEAELIAGTGPDLFANYGQIEKTSKWIKDGMLTDIGAIIEAEPDRYPILASMISSPAFKMYNDYYGGDANKTYAIYALYPSKGWAGASVYNKSILKAAGYDKAPETLDEFIDFTTKTGKSGKIGWWPRNNKLANDAGLNEMDKTICAPNGTTMMPPAGNAWSGFMPTDPKNVSGTWKMMTTSDETKASIKTLNKMYKDKALDNTIGVKDDFAEAINDFVTGKIGACNYGFANYGQYDWVVTDKWLKGNPTGSYEDLVLGAPLKGSAGRAVTYNAPFWMGYNWVIPQSCKNPDRVLDMIEYLASDAGQTLLFCGTEDMYTKAADGKITRDAAKWKTVNDIYANEDNRTQYLWFVELFTANQAQLNLEAKGDWYETVMNPAVYDRYPDGPQKDYGMGVLNSYGLESFGELPPYFTIIPFSEEVNAIRTKLKEITLQYVPSFISGQKNVDTDWAEYVKAYEDAGCKKVEDEFNAGISAAKASYESFQK